MATLKLYAKIVTLTVFLLSLVSCAKITDASEIGPEMYCLTYDGKLYNGVIYQKPTVRLLIYTGPESEYYDIDLQSEMSDYIAHESGQGKHVALITLEHPSFHKMGINTVLVTVRKKGEKEICYKELVRYEMKEVLDVAPDFYIGMSFGKKNRSSFIHPTEVVEIETDRSYDVDTYYFGPKILHQRVKEVTLEGMHVEIDFHQYDQEAYGRLWAEKEGTGEVVFEVENEYAAWEYRYQFIVHKAPDKPIIFNNYEN